MLRSGNAEMLRIGCLNTRLGERLPARAQGHQVRRAAGPGAAAPIRPHARFSAQSGDAELHRR
eukprot:14319148-Alexandrium_andersonii.AAC.1